MGSLAHKKYGDMWIQLQNLRQWRQAVVSFWNTVEENPCVSSCCVAFKSDSACTWMEGGASSKFFWGKVRLKCWRKIHYEKWMRRDAESSILLSSILLYYPFAHPMEAKIWLWRVRRARFRRIGHTAEEELTLTLLDQPLNSVLSTNVWM